MAILKAEAQDEDWRTAAAKRKEPIPAGEEVKITGIIKNWYGFFVVVEYSGEKYNVKPDRIEAKLKEWEAGGLTLNGVTVPPEKIMMMIEAI